MSFNLVDLIRDQISDQLLGQMSNLLGSEGSKTQSALNSAIPGVLGGLAGSVASPTGAESLFKTVEDQDEGLLDNMGDLLNGSNALSLIDNGNAAMGGLLGDGIAGKLAGTISSAAGLSTAGSSSLLGMLAPIIIGVIKRKVLGDGLDASGLASMLSDQSSNIAAAIPDGLENQLSFSALSSLSDTATDAVSDVSNLASDAVASVVDTASGAADDALDSVTTVVDDVSDTGSPLKRWLLPAVAIIALAWIGLRFFGGSVDDNAAIDATVADSASQAADTATESVEEAASTVAEDTMSEAEKAAAEARDIAESLGSNLGGMIDNVTSTLGDISDVESAQAAVPALTDMASNISEFKTLYEQAPNAARGPLAGVVGAGMSTLLPLIEKLMEMPGVGPIIEPFIQPIMETLESMQE